MQIWNLCFWLSLAAISVSVLLIIRVRTNPRLAMYIGIAGVILSTTIIVLPYYLSKENLLVGFLESLLVSLKIFIMNDSYTEVSKSVSENLSGGYSFAYTVVIALLYLIAPLLTATFIFEYLSSFFPYLRIRLNKRQDIYLFSELNSNSLALARSINKEMKCGNPKVKKGIIAFSGIEKSPDIEKMSLLQVAKEEHFWCIKQQSASLKIQNDKNRKIHFLQMSENEDKNLNSALMLIDKYKDINSNVNIYISSSQPEAEVILDSIAKATIQTRIINQSQAYAYHLFNEIPLFSADVMKNKKISILLIGSGYIGMEILKAATWCGQMDGLNLEINVIDAQANRLKKEFEFECPELMNGEYNINFYEADVLTADFQKVLQEKCQDSNYIIVTLGQDDLNIKTALYLRRHYLLSDPEYKNWPIITLLVRDEEKFKVISQLKTSSNSEERRKGFDLRPFGDTEKLYSYDVLLNSCLDRLALNVHALYESNYRTDSEISLANILPGFSKYELYRRSNLANALHIQYKLWSIGLEYVHEDSEQSEVNYILTEEIKNKLVQLEHKRWVAFQRAEGWRSVTVEGAKKYMAAGMNDKHRHYIAKLHPCICDFDQLQIMCDEFDPHFIEYDKSFIEKLPYILEDKWGLTGDKYKIIERSA